jgi:hypothetical protein
MPSEMQMVHSRKFEFIDAETLTECTEREILFRTKNGFVLYLTDRCSIRSAQERATFLEAREALLWLNEKEPSFGWLWNSGG